MSRCAWRKRPSGGYAGAGTRLHRATSREGSWVDLAPSPCLGPLLGRRQGRLWPAFLLNQGTTSIPRKSRKKEGGIKGPQARTGGSSGFPRAPLFFKPPKKHREGPGKGANKQNSKKRKLQEYGEMRTSEAFASGCCSSIGYLGIFAKERRPQRSLRPPRPSDRALSVSLLRIRLLQA